MPDISFTNLLGVLAVALLAPLAVGLVPWLRVPAVVVEIVLGVVLGPHLAGWLHLDLAVQIVGLLGLAMLLFLAGLEVEVDRLRGRVLLVAAAGYVVSLVLGSGIGAGMHLAGWVSDPLLLGVALSATSLGLVVPVLKDAGHVETALGQAVIASASLADFGAVLLLSLLFSVDSRGTGAKLLSLGVFVGLIAVAGVATWLSSRSMRLTDVFRRLQDTSAEIRVRAAMLLLICFVVLAERFGLESILGAFLAGACIAVLDRDSSTHPHFRLKLEAVGYGFLIPVFFVSSGMRLDVSGLLSDPAQAARVPVFLLALLLARGLPALLWRSRLGPRETVAAALLQATSLPFLVTASQIGVVTGRMSMATATALVCAGLLSVLLFPVAAVSQIGRRSADLTLATDRRRWAASPR